jgi:uncharacterized protein (TIGR00369 family)
MAESVFDRLKMPPSAALLGWRLKDLNVAEKTITVGYEAKPEFLNPVGNVQGGILAAMLDETLGAVVLAVTNGEFTTATVDLHVSYIRPVKPGPISVVAQITNMGKQLAFMEGKLFSGDGKLSARAIGSSVLLKVDERAFQ